MIRYKQGEIEEKAYTGRIIKGIGGFYYVEVSNVGVFTCRAKGLFRNEKVKPLVGDMVRLHPVTDTDIDNPGHIDEILERHSEVIRPAMANVDQIFIIFAAADPPINLNLLDRFLCESERRGIPALICFNKCDLIDEYEKAKLCKIYEPAGYEVLTVSAKNKDISSLKERLSGKISALAGPSGAGKSTIVNLLQSQTVMETGIISKKLGRGKHTTRHAQLLKVDGMDDTYIADTPGFSSFDIMEESAENLGALFPEIDRYSGECRFALCSHIKEKECGVKRALAEGLIAASRYESYSLFYEEIRSRRNY